MEYRRMGSTGLKVSELCLGAMTFGREIGEAESRTLFDRFLEAGGNFIDTADRYSGGASEHILGQIIKGRQRDELVIATKVYYPVGSQPNDSGLSRKHILTAVEDSLRRLDTDYIDLYQMHMWDFYTPLEETLQTLDGLVQSGKVRYLGVSNYTGAQLQKAIEISRHMGWEAFTCLQPLYNLLDRETEWELVPVCLEEGLGIIPWSPLRGGWLSGKYRRGMSGAISGTRAEEAARRGWSETWDNYNNEHTWGVIDELLAVAQESGKSPAQVALNWLLQMPGVTAPIIGARNMEQLEDNLGAVGWALSAEQMARLNKASHKPLPYPYNTQQR